MTDKKQPRVKILVACHKADPNIRQDDIYMPIQVGKALHPELDLGFQCDNTGDNISEKNGSYCELTALYWAWKNLKDVDYIGLCHYRRYFDYTITPDNIAKDMLNYDVIALTPRNNPFSASTDLNLLLTQEDVAIAIQSLINAMPQYKNAAIKYLYNNNKVSQCNMFIMKWSDFEQYCEFLFTLLFRIEKNLLPHSYTRLRRNIGYIAENFQGLYFLYNNLHVKYIGKKEIGLKTKNRFLTAIQSIRNNIMFRAVRHPKDINIYKSVNVGLISDGVKLENV